MNSQEASEIKVDMSGIFEKIKKRAEAGFEYVQYSPISDKQIKILRSGPYPYHVSGLCGTYANISWGSLQKKAEEKQLVVAKSLSLLTKIRLFFSGTSEGS
jgi:hypothetical protein